MFSKLKRSMSRVNGQKAVAGATLAALLCGPGSAGMFAADHTYPTKTPIKHLVVIFQENISFDHYFGTYPYATNPPGEPYFYAKRDTPGVNGFTPALLTANTNLANPFRLDRSQAVTCDMNHGYAAEQKAFDGGLMDKFVEYTSSSGCEPKQVMGYFDGNTVTALWNYAQNFSMSDNSYSTQFGPSTPGALNVISGNTFGATGTSGAITGSTVTGDADPLYDDCSKGSKIAMDDTSINIGTLLNAKGISWGWFEGGFRPSSVSNGVATCATSHTGLAGTSADYVPHHQPFQYYASTSNPHHLRPTSVSMIGKQGDQANHQYDLSDFWDAVDAGNMPAISYLKAPAYQDGHPGYSDPIDEQIFLVQTINRLMASRYWDSLAIIIAYDDSDGWYDHQMGPIIRQSNTTADALFDGSCGVSSNAGNQGRCGFGPRQPLLVISPYARVNNVDHTVTDQSSVVRFIEDNWGLGFIGNGSSDAVAGTLLNNFDFRRPVADRLFLDHSTGLPVRGGHGHGW